jgi:hypothetical protein
MSDGGPVPISLEPGQIQRAPQTLAQKLVAAALAIETVEKDKRNTFHKYDYASIEAVVSAVRGELLQRGVLVLAGEAETQDRPRATREGESVVTTVHLVFTLLDAETGERLEIPWLGRGDDPADKGVAKALTDARKSFLIQQLNLSRGEDTEAERRSVRDRQPDPGRQGPARPAAQRDSRGQRPPSRPGSLRRLRSHPF